MKIICSLFFLLVLFSAGCSTNYAVKEFETEKDFYKFFNNHAGNKRLNILLNSDSTITAASGAKIRTDSLLFDEDKIKTGNEIIPLSEINSIDYISADYKSAKLSLKNGRELYSKNIIFKHDSLKCEASENFIINISLPLNSIKAANYNTHWKGIFPGFFSGILIGGVLGALTFNIESGGNSPKVDHTQGAFLGGITGAIMGMFTGFIIGWNTNFHF